MPRGGIFLVPILVAFGWLPVFTRIGNGQASPSPGTIAPGDAGAIQGAVDVAFRQGLHRVVIPPGVYRFGVEAPAGFYLAFKHFKDFEIDATGATLIFTTPGKGSIALSSCTNVTFRGATLIRDPIPFSQGEISAVGADRKTIDVRVAQGYPVPDGHSFHLFALNLYDPATRRWLAEDYASDQNIEPLGPGSFRFHAHQAVGAHAGWDVGAHVAWRGWGVNDILLQDCEGMKMTGITIESGAGFCMLETNGEGGNFYNYTVTYGPKPAGATEEPLMASDADAFHSFAVRRGPTLDGCRFEGMNDDGVPIHGQYAFVEQSQGNDLIAEVQSPPFCRAGDALRLYDARGALAGEAKVVAAAPVAYSPATLPPEEFRLFHRLDHPAFERITLDQPVAAAFSWLIANASANGSGFVVRNCTIRNHRGRGMLIKASDGVIENCTFEACSMGGIIIAPEMGYWNEADYARNITVRHNLLRDVDYWQEPGASQAGALSITACEHGRFVPLPGGHRQIVVEDNSFENDDGTNLLVTSAEGVTIRDNHFLQPMENATARGRALQVDPTALIWLAECSGVDLAGNVVASPGPYFKSAVVATPTASGNGLVDGVTVQK